ncbi:MAG TPA: AsmA-like C-terminal region-containing protein [Planctomycetota bacterium]|nr:AsmA-like C-terminal region-containing protein [Planctomycetota bacterium]
MVKKLWGLFAMFLIVAGLAGLDVYVLTRAESLSMLAEGELRKIAGDVLEWDHIGASIENAVALQGTVTLQGVRGFPLARRLPPVQARRVAIHLRSGFPERFVLEDIRGVISDELFDELTGKETGKSIREVIPDPSRLPTFVVHGGQFEIRLGGIFQDAKPQTVTVVGMTMVPIGGYRYHFEAEFTHPLYGRWLERGELDLDSGAQRITLDCLGLRITPGMRAPLIGRFRRIYDMYLPGGLCDIHIAIEKEPKQEPDIKVTLVARDMTFTYGNFPYPTEHISGEIDFFTSHLVIKNMQGRHGPATVRFDGAAGGYTTESEFNFRFEVDDMPLDEALRQALDPTNRRVFDSFSPRGRVSAKGKATRGRGANNQEHIPLTLSFDGVSMTYKEFPYELKNVTGEIQVDGTQIVVKRATVRDGSMEAEIRGTIGNIAGDASVDLNIDAQRLPLDAKLRSAIGDDARKIWDQFTPGGEMELHWLMHKETGSPVVHSARGRCKGNTALYKDLPLPVTNLSGDIEMTPGRYSLDHLVGRVKGAEVEIHGTVTDAQMSLHVDATSLPLDDEVKNALPPGVGDFLRMLKIGGMVSFQSGLTFKKDGQKQVDLVCKLLKGYIDTEPRFEDLDGTVTLTGYFEKDPEMIGFINCSRATVYGKRISDVGASFNTRGSKLNFLNLKASVYGGVLAGRSFSLDTKTKDFFGEAFTIDRVDLQEFVRDTKSYSDKNMSGKISLDLRDVRGNSQDSASITGKGRAVVRDALLWDIPIFLKLFTLNPGELFKTRNQFDAGVVDFDIRQRKITIDRMAFTSESVSVVGRGAIGFDGDLHLILKPRSGPLLGLDFFVLRWAGDLVSFLLDSVVSVEVKGTFDKPEVK